MKKVFTLLMTLISCIAFAQDPMYAGSDNKKEVIDYNNGPHPNKKDNVIVLETNDNYETAFRNIVSILGEYGFGLHNVNKEYGQITTTEKPVKKVGSVILNLTVREVDGKTRISIRGGMDTNTALTIDVITVEGMQELYFGGMKGSPLRNGWNELEKVARSYTNATISYENR